jgi:iron complex outermembrane receptor protein
MLDLSARLTRLSIACVLVMLTAMPSAATAQGGTIRGVVVDSEGVAISDASVAIVALHRVARTDATGRFVFTKLEPGPIAISARRLGYAPDSVRLSLTSGGIDSVRVILAELPEVLSAINVSAEERHRRQRIEDFYWRRARGLGRYVTRDEILSQRATVPSDALRTTPGIRLVRSGTATGVRFTTATGQRAGCIPMLWIDGHRAPGMELDEVPLNDIEGIELYNGPATTPPEFWLGNTAQCGTIVVWIRLPGS